MELSCLPLTISQKASHRSNSICSNSCVLCANVSAKSAHRTDLRNYCTLIALLFLSTPCLTLKRWEERSTCLEMWTCTGKQQQVQGCCYMCGDKVMQEGVTRVGSQRKGGGWLGGVKGEEEEQGFSTLQRPLQLTVPPSLSRGHDPTFSIGRGSRCQNMPTFKFISISFLKIFKYWRNLYVSSCGIFSSWWKGSLWWRWQPWLKTKIKVESCNHEQS